MLLDPAQAPASLESDGETLHFCSHGCLVEYGEHGAEPATGSRLQATPTRAIRT